jgi:hypothetical protein
MQRSSRSIIVIVAVIALGFLAYGVLTMPDQRTPTDKISDAVDELPNGVDKAARELEDRTPGERIGDSIRDNTQAQ